MKLKNKVAIVTGGASGFGKGIVKKFINEGAKVLVADLNYEAAQELSKDCDNENIVPLKIDVSKKDDVKTMFQKIIESFGKLDILVQNAAIGMKPTPLVDTTEELFEKIFNINVKSVFLGAKYSIPLFKKQGSGGVILNIISTAAIRPRPGLTVYNSSKGALIPMTKALALETADYNVRVNGLCPVAGETPMLKEFLGDDDPKSSHKKFISTVPLGRLAEPEDIANASLFLCSEESKFITGVMLEVDGGRTI